MYTSTKLSISNTKLSRPHIPLRSSKTYILTKINLLQKLILKHNLEYRNNILLFNLWITYKLLYLEKKHRTLGSDVFWKKVQFDSRFFSKWISFSLEKRSVYHCNDSYSTETKMKNLMRQGWSNFFYFRKIHRLIIFLTLLYILTKKKFNFLLLKP